MDPKETLEMLVKATARIDRDESIEHAKALQDWLLTGGFVPEMSEKQLRIILIGYTQYIINYLH